MSITVELEDATTDLVERQAREAGTDVTSYVARLVRKAAIRERYDSVFKPIQETLGQVGASEKEWDRLIEEAREEVWREAHGTASHE